MTLKPTLSLDALDANSETTPSPLVNRYPQIYLKNEDNRLLLVLPPQAEINADLPWSETWQELKYLLQAKEQSWQEGTAISLVAHDRLLDSRQLQAIAETLNEVKLCLTAVSTNRRQTAVAAATSGYSVEQKARETSLTAETTDTQPATLAEPLYLQNTVRSGVEIRHPGTIVILGDLNPGGKAVAAGDIFVWGRLRGVAHAGAQGNRQCRIGAIQMEFTQLRIADSVARSPKKHPKRFEPEVAFVTTEGICLAKTLVFGKNYVFSPSRGGWVDKNQPK